MLSKEGFIVLRHYLGEGISKAAVARKLGVPDVVVEEADAVVEEVEETEPEKPARRMTILRKAKKDTERDDQQA